MSEPAPVAAESGPPRPPSRKGGILRAALRGCLYGLGLALLFEGCQVFLGDNLHVLIPGEVYRCGQLSGARLEQVIGQRGIRTVINLRGCCAPQDWYLAECRATHRTNTNQEDISMSAGRFPSTHELRYLLEVLERCDYPILIHCKQGADRTGLVSALILLLRTNTPLEQARQQLTVRYGHVAIGRPSNLDRFLELYTHWLERQQRDHSAQALRDWLADSNCPGEYRCTFQPLDFPRTLPFNQPTALKLRARNDGRTPWLFQPEDNAGIHLCYTLRNEDEQSVANARAGMYHAQVLPGESIELTLALPPLTRAGRYRLRVDLVDEPHCIFAQTGEEPLDWEFEVADPGEQASR
jgi:protein tyrosine phosphatase (PTP) superfamily phosphohydrolase (DUF442 family)